MRNICLFLDDGRHPTEVTWVEYPPLTEFYVVRSVAEFKEKFKELQPNMVSFDHDLGVDQNGKELPTGYAAVKEAIAELFNNDEQKIPEAIFHSKNPVGSKNMRVYWKNGIREINNLRNGEF